VSTSITEPMWLTIRELSERLHVPVHTLRSWRSRGVGPPFARLGPQTVRYRLDEVERWEEARQVRRGGGAA
jgi:DNA-binding transcriptional MerR regulator